MITVDQHDADMRRRTRALRAVHKRVTRAAVAARSCTPQSPLEGLALHEAGHAVVARALGLGVVSATIAPDKSSGGHVSYEKPPAAAATDYFLRRCIATAAGAIAQRMLAPTTLRPLTCYFDDNLIRDFLVVAATGPAAARSLGDYVTRSARDHVRWSKFHIRVVADLLLERITASGRDIDEAIAKADAATAEVKRRARELLLADPDHDLRGVPRRQDMARFLYRGPPPGPSRECVNAALIAEIKRAGVSGAIRDAAVQRLVNDGWDRVHAAEALDGRFAAFKC